jgi:hypothetical protein
MTPSFNEGFHAASTHGGKGKDKDRRSKKGLHSLL